MSVPLTIAIPTYGRDQVLVETLEHLLALPVRAEEIIVMDQTPLHAPDAESRLRELADSGSIQWLRLKQPSIPAAMNRALIAASHEIVLFLDDDIRPEPDLIHAHFAAHQPSGVQLVAGRVLQPWDEAGQVDSAPNFHFASLEPQWICEFMGGNFSVRRSVALNLGGFDENFVRVAYRFEADFAHRFCGAGRRIWYEPTACIHHLKAHIGGTRSYGEHLTTWRPDHAVGAYYYGLRTHALHEFLSRPYRAVATRYHLLHPWRIPGTLLAELSGMLWALCLFARGPRRLRRTTGEDSA